LLLAGGGSSLADVVQGSQGPNVLQSPDLTSSARSRSSPQHAVVQSHAQSVRVPGTAGVTQHAADADSGTCQSFRINSHTHSVNGPLSGTTRVCQYQTGKTNLDFTDARDGKWQWHQLGHMQVCTSLQTDNHASTPPLCFLQAGCPSCRPTNNVKALKDTKH